MREKGRERAYVKLGTALKCNGTHCFTLRVHTFPMNWAAPRRTERAYTQRPKSKRETQTRWTEKYGEFSDLFSSLLFVAFVSFIPFHSIWINLLFEIWKSDRVKNRTSKLEICSCFFPSNFTWNLRCDCQVGSPTHVGIISAIDDRSIFERKKWFLIQKYDCYVCACACACRPTLI